MNRTHDLTCLALLALGFAFVAPSCDEDAPAQKPAAAVVAKPEPTTAAALERSRQYWVSVEKGDWLPTYDMMAPEVKEQMPIAQYLQSKVNHRYEQVRVEEVVAQQDNHIFLRISGLWTPTHPMARKVKLEPGQTLTTPFVLIESWRWENDTWLFERRLRPEEFTEEFPDLRQGATPTPPADPAPAK